jgi:two-component system alkaline phosphatase synthesis response regulator PhoP
MMDLRGSRVLIVEDDPGLADGIRENLRLEGYDTELAMDGRVGLDLATSGDFDLIVLDVMLPSMDGFEVCSRLRKAGRDVPVLFLSARGDPTDRIQGLEAGGDDYLPKPFQLKELLLRVAAIIRRRRGAETPTEDDVRVAFAENEVDFRTYRGRSWDGREHELTQKEAEILRTLCGKEGEVVSREEILEKVWGYEVYPSSRTLETFIGRLRKRFERDGERPAHFHTAPGIGWRFTKQPEASDA